MARLTTIRFHLDENVSNAVALGLRQRGIDVTTTAEQGLLGVGDLGQLEFVRVEGRVLFTQDADFLRLHQAGTEHPGLVFCRKDSRNLGEIVRGLILLWELLDPEDMHGHVEFI